jgi:hypothetical protein
MTVPIVNSCSGHAILEEESTAAVSAGGQGIAMSERWASGGAREVEKRRYAFEALTAGSAGRREAAMQRARRVCASG